MLLSSRVRDAEDCLGASLEISLGSDAVAPLAQLGDEQEEAHQLVVDDVIVSAIWPEDIRPHAIELQRELVDSRWVGPGREELLEARLEGFEGGKRFPPRIHLDVKVLAQPHPLHGKDVESNRRR